MRSRCDDWAIAAVDIKQSGLDALRRDAGPAVVGVVGDVSDRSTSETAGRVAAELGDSTGWVNNAGIDPPGAAHTLKEADMHRLLEVNLVGVIWGCCESIEYFLERGGGTIVSISSIQAICGFPDSFVYAASKGGINSLTRQIATEYGPFGIRANAVMSGTFRTQMAIESWRRAPVPQRPSETMSVFIRWDVSETRQRLLRRWHFSFPRKRRSSPVNASRWMEARLLAALPIHRARSSSIATACGRVNTEATMVSPAARPRARSRP